MVFCLSGPGSNPGLFFGFLGSLDVGSFLASRAHENEEFLNLYLLLIFQHCEVARCVIKCCTEMIIKRPGIG